MEERAGLGWLALDSWGALEDEEAALLEMAEGGLDMIGPGGQSRRRAEGNKGAVAVVAAGGGGFRAAVVVPGGGRIVRVLFECVK